MAPTWIPGVIAFLTCVSAVPPVIRLARRWNVLDRPGPLKIHARPVPRMGGVAMMAALSASLTFLFVAAPQPRSHWLAILAFGCVWTASLVDDVRGLPSWLRLGVHLAAGSALWLGGWRLTEIGGAVLSLLATCLFVALVVNAMNLLDGLDGLAAGVGAVAALGFIGLFAATSASAALSQALAGSLLGICLGILAFNFPPARIFMGDSGSTLLGVLCAFLMLDWARRGADPYGALLPALFLLLPLADVVLAVLRRLRTRASPFSGDRAHFYDLLLRRGWSARGVLFFSAAATGLMVLLGWLSVGEVWLLPLAVPFVAGALAVGVWFLGSLRPAPEAVQPRQKDVSLSAAE